MTGDPGPEPNMSFVRSGSNLVGSLLNSAKFGLGVAGAYSTITQNSSLGETSVDIFSPHFGGMATHNQAAAWEKELFYAIAWGAYKLGINSKDPGPYNNFHIK